jgi:hypothetical protein
MHGTTMMTMKMKFLKRIFFLKTTGNGRTNRRTVVGLAALMLS